jgi:hypothetical protein
MLAFRGDLRARAWIVAVPAILYALWYLRYGHQASETHLSLWKTALPYTVQELSATIGALLGLSTAPNGLLDLTYGAPAALAAIAGVAVALWRGWRPSPMFWALSATVGVLWVAASMSNVYPTTWRPPNDPRYLSSNAAMLLVCLCVAVPRPRLGRRGVLGVLAVLGIVCATNASQYAVGRGLRLASDSASRADLGALIMMRGLVSPAFSPAPPGPPATINDVVAGPFFSAVDSFGILADSPSTLLHSDETTKEIADAALQRGELLALAPAAGRATSGTVAPAVASGPGRRVGGCVVVGDVPVVVRADPGTFQLTAGADGALIVSMARFADRYDIPLGTVAPEHTARVRIPTDRAPGVPWRMFLSGRGGRVCKLVS